jgi:hypothetical protein
VFSKFIQLKLSMKKQKQAASSKQASTEVKQNALKRNFAERSEADSSTKSLEVNLKRGKTDQLLITKKDGDIKTNVPVKPSSEKGFTGASSQWFDSK